MTPATDNNDIHSLTCFFYKNVEMVRGTFKILQNVVMITSNFKKICQKVVMTIGTFKILQKCGYDHDYEKSSFDDNIVYFFGIVL